MILTTEQTTSLLSEDGIYDWILNKRRWSHLLFGNETSAHGNIVSFTSPMNIGDKRLSKAVIFAAELPNVEMFGGVCFQRLLTAQAGSILCEIINKGCHVDESSVFVEKQQTSISVANHIKGSTLFHNVFSMCEQNNELLYPLVLTEDLLQTFQEKVIGAFHYLSRSAFLESQRDNF